MTESELWWCIRKEGYQTSVLAWTKTPASGGTNWLIRIGSIITLAELLHFGNEVCTCYDMYCLYLTLPIFIYKKAHSISSSPNAQKMRNAKALRHHGTGRWGLPSK